MLTFAAAHTHCWDTYARRCTQHTHGHTHTYSHTHTYCFAARGIQKCGKRFPSSRAILPRRPTVRFRDEVLTNCPTTVLAEMGELAALPMLPTALCCRARCLNLQTLGERERASAEDNPESTQQSERKSNSRGLAQSSPARCLTTLLIVRSFAVPGASIAA